MNKTQSPNWAHAIRVHEYLMLNIQANVVVPGIRFTCACGEVSPNCPTTDDAVQLGFAHLDKVMVS